MIEDNPDIFATPTPSDLTEEQIMCKRRIYETMSPRRRRFVDRMGYNAWDPFQKPKDPMDIRLDMSGRTCRELLYLFFQEKKCGSNETPGNAYSQGALHCALGIINKDEKYRGVYEFCLWYNKLVNRGGK